MKSDTVGLSVKSRVPEPVKSFSVVDRSTQTISKRTISLIAGVPDATSTLINKLQEYDVELYGCYSEINRICARMKLSMNSRLQKRSIKSIRHNLHLCEIICERRCFVMGKISAEVTRRLSLLEVSGINLSDSEPEYIEADSITMSALPESSDVIVQTMFNPIENKQTEMLKPPAKIRQSAMKRKPNPTLRTMNKKAKLASTNKEIMTVKADSNELPSCDETHIYTSTSLRSFNKSPHTFKSDISNVETTSSKSKFKAINTNNSSRSKRRKYTSVNNKTVPNKNARSLARLRSKLEISMNDYKTNPINSRPLRLSRRRQSSSARPIVPISKTKRTTYRNTSAAARRTKVKRRRKGIFCICRQPSFGQMIFCDNKQCTIKWFHFNCAGIIEIPKGKWYCCNCRKKTENRRLNCLSTAKQSTAAKSVHPNSSEQKMMCVRKTLGNNRSSIASKNVRKPSSARPSLPRKRTTCVAVQKRNGEKTKQNDEPRVNTESLPKLDFDQVACSISNSQQSCLVSNRAIIHSLENIDDQTTVDCVPNDNGNNNANDNDNKEDDDDDDDDDDGNNDRSISTKSKQSHTSNSKEIDPNVLSSDAARNSAAVSSDVTQK